jgi:hypothetical protein
MPRSVTPIVVLNDLTCIPDDLTTEELISVVEVHPDQLARVEEPIVMVWEPGSQSLIAKQIPDVLAGRVGMLRARHTEPAVVRQRHTHHPHS